MADKSSLSGVVDQSSDPDRQPVDEARYPEPEPQNDGSIHWSSFACELGLQGLELVIVLTSSLESLQQDYVCLNLSS